jgi:hypothetical protein
MNIDNLNLELTKGKVRVEFTKVDGSHRSMLCTKNLVPQTENKKTKTIKKLNENVLRVFDLEKEDWRSIKIESIQSWKVEN